MLNNITEFNMDGRKLKLITPIELSTGVDVYGNTVFYVAYQSDAYGVEEVPLHVVNSLRTTYGTTRMRNDTPSIGRTDVLPDVSMAAEVATTQQHNVARVFESPEYNLRKSPTARVREPRQDLPDVPFTNPTRNLPFTLRPDPHLDKTLLTKQELQEVLLWALEVSNYDGWPLVDAPENTSPDSALAKIGAYLATLVYGPNNYIGAEKTGDIGVSTLENVVTTVPALSEADARARAHDIALAVTSNPAVDTILPPLGQAAQVLRPLFNSDQERQPVPRNALIPSRGGATNKSLLKLAGDVEENPGPPKKYSKETAAEESMLYANPKVYYDRINLVNRTLSDYQRVFYANGDPLMMRGLADERSDIFYPDDGICQFSGWTWGNVPTVLNRINYYGHKLFKFGIASDTPKTPELPPGALGAALNGTLLAFNDLLALQRTATNTLDGNPELNIYTRTPKTDFGCWVPMTKVLLCEMLRAPLSGDWSLDWCDNIMAKRAGNYVNTAAIFPNSENADNGAGGGGPPPISAWCINSRVLASLLLNNVVATPPGWPGLENSNTAYIPISDEIEPDTLSYITIANLEFPFSNNTIRPRVDSMTPAGFVGQLAPTEHGDYRNLNLIAGPRENIVYVLCSESNVLNMPIGDAGGNFLNIPIWTDPNVPVGATNVAPFLVTYDNAEISGRNRTTWTKDFLPTMSYFFRFADKDDWNAACSMTSTCMSSIGHFQRLKWNDTVANSGSIVISNGAVPTLAPSVANTQSWDIPVGQSGPSVLNWRTWYPVWNDRGMLADNSAEPAIGTARVSGQIMAYLQDTPWLTKLGIYKKYFAKKTLEPVDVNTYFIGGPMSFFYLILTGTRLRAEMLHNLVQERGIVNRDVLLRTPMVVDRQQAVWNSIDKMVTAYDKLLAGWNFYRPSRIRTLLNAQPAPAGTVPGLNTAGLGWFYDSPLYFANPLLNKTDDSLGIYPATSTGFLPSRIHADWEPNASGQIQIYGTATGGALSVGTVPAHERSGLHPKSVRDLWAIAHTTKLDNPAPNVALTNFYLLRGKSNARNPQFDRNVLTSTYTGNLRWIDSTENQATSIGATRHLIICLPFYPRAMEMITGQQFVVAAVTVGAANAIAGSIDIKGMGSATYATIDLPGSNAFDILSGYENMLGKEDDKDNVAPPGGDVVKKE